MSEEEAKKLQIENLVFKLTSMAQLRRDLHDQIWTLEAEGEKLSLKLVKLLTEDKK